MITHNIFFHTIIPHIYRHSWKLQYCLPLAVSGGDCACAPPYGEHLRWLKAQHPSCKMLCQFDPRRPWYPFPHLCQPGWVQPPDSLCREGAYMPEMHLWTATLPQTEKEEGALPENEAESWENAEVQSYPDLRFFFQDEASFLLAQTCLTTCQLVSIFKLWSFLSWCFFNCCCPFILFFFPVQFISALLLLWLHSQLGRSLWL